MIFLSPSPAQAFLELALGLPLLCFSYGRVQKEEGYWRGAAVNKVVMCGSVLILEAYTEKPPLHRPTPTPSTRKPILAQVSGPQNHRQAAGGEGEVRSTPETTQ